MNELCVIVINYQAAETTRRCLESLRSESFDTLHVLDNSADPVGTRDFRQMMSAFQENVHPWKLVVEINAENLGFGRAINQVIQADRMKGEGHRRYLLMNNDAVGSPGFVSKLVSRANQSNEVGLVTPRILWGDSWVGLMWYQRITAHISKDRRWGSFAYATGCCLLVDSRLVADDGRLFDEAFFMYGEDVLLTWQAMRRGLAVICAEDVIVEHQGSAGSVHGGSFYEYQIVRAHWLLGERLSRNYWDKVSIRTIRLAYLLARAILRSFRFRTITPIRALLNCMFE